MRDEAVMAEELAPGEVRHQGDRAKSMEDVVQGERPEGGQADGEDVCDRLIGALGHENEVKCKLIHLGQGLGK